MLDGTKLAQMVLSAIYRSGQFFGTIHIINILLGNKTDKIIDIKDEDIYSLKVISNLDTEICVSYEKNKINCTKYR